MHRRRMMKVFQLFDVETSEPRVVTHTHHLHPPPSTGAGDGGQQLFDIERCTLREHLEVEILQSSLELGNQDINNIDIIYEENTEALIV